VPEEIGAGRAAAKPALTKESRSDFVDVFDRYLVDVSARSIGKYLQFRKWYWTEPRHALRPKLLAHWSIPSRFRFIRKVSSVSRFIHINRGSACQALPRS
jgi:hypothetical protein